MKKKKNLLNELSDLLGSQRVSSTKLWDLLKQGYEQDPEAYADQWLPVLAGAQLPPFVAETHEQLVTLASLLPSEASLYANFGDVFGDDRSILEVLESPLVHRLTELSIMHADLEGLKAILKHPGMASVRGLRLGGFDEYEWGSEAIEFLANADTLNGLRSLSFVRAREFSNESCIALANAPTLHRLEAFTFPRPPLEDCPIEAISDTGVTAIIAAMPNLVYVDLQACVSLTGAVLEQAANLKGLRGLGFNGDLVEPSAALSTLMQQLTHLDLSQSQFAVGRKITSELVATLTKRPTQLRYLQLARNGFDRTTFAELAASEAFPELVHLGFFDIDDWSHADQSGPIDDFPDQTDIEGLINSPCFPKLASVSFVNGDGYPEQLKVGSSGEWNSDGDGLGWEEPRFPLR
jgi:hypothetical protein